MSEGFSPWIMSGFFMIVFILGAFVRNAIKVRHVLLSNNIVLQQKCVRYTKDNLTIQIVEISSSFQTGRVGKITHGS